MSERKLLLLIIKGDKDIATKAASDRGIPLDLHYENRPFAGRVETVGTTKIDHIDEVSNWLNEPINNFSSGKAPYDEGALISWKIWP